MTGRIGGHKEGVESKTVKPVIEERDGGPLVAKNLDRLLDADGEPLDTKSIVALCRCGASKRKPYCDGSHNDIGFDSSLSEDRSPDELKAYEGKDITVHYNRLLCSHAGECGKHLKSVFDPSRKPWIDPDAGQVDEIISTVRICPSGALSYSLHGNSPQHEIEGEAGISIEKDGPYRVIGIPLASSHTAEGMCADKYVLCRCGASRNKPFCDGTHHDIK
nr:CDGSH iron-sulfur domain-containing protein [Roseibium sp.]